MVRLKDARLPKGLVIGDVVMGARGPGGQKLRRKDTKKRSLKRLQINRETWEDPDHSRLEETSEERRDHSRKEPDRRRRSQKGCSQTSGVFDSHYRL
nr:unnamed protein product [Spirometra erinaceieuropaei]